MININFRIHHRILMQTHLFHMVHLHMIYVHKMKINLWTIFTYNIIWKTFKPKLPTKRACYYNKPHCSHCVLYLYVNSLYKVEIFPDGLACLTSSFRWMFHIHAEKKDKWADRIKTKMLNGFSNVSQVYSFPHTTYSDGVEHNPRMFRKPRNYRWFLLQGCQWIKCCPIVMFSLW